MCFRGKENSLVDSAMFDKKNLMQISYKSKVPENSSKKLKVRQIAEFRSNF